MSQAHDTPDLELARQRRVAVVLRSSGPAMPERLLASLDALQAQAARRRRHGFRPAFAAPHRRLVGGFALAASATVVLLVLVLTVGGSAGGLSAAQVASLWTRPATSGAVAPAPHNPAALEVSFHGTSYPNYHDTEGWHPVGTRVDSIGGRRALTVFYATGARRAAYTVVTATTVRVPSGVRPFTAGGRRLIEFRTGDHWVVVFADHGNTCILTAAAPRERAWLVKLAVWHSAGATGPQA